MNTVRASARPLTVQRGGQGFRQGLVGAAVTSRPEVTRGGQSSAHSHVHSREDSAVHGAVGLGDRSCRLRGQLASLRHSHQTGTWRGRILSHFLKAGNDAKWKN